MENKIELFAVVELFGHTRISGTITEQSIGPATFIRVDVPETKTQGKFTRIINPSAIYAINPVTQEVMIEMAERIVSKPIDVWDIRDMEKKLTLQLSEKSPQKNDHSFDEDHF